MALTVEQLIKELEKYPKDLKVKIFDWRKNFHEESGDPNYEGIYDFQLHQEKLSKDELEYYKEMHDREYVPWLQLSFENSDYTDDVERLD